MHTYEIKLTLQDWVAYLRLFVKKNEIIRFENEEKAIKIHEKLDKKKFIRDGKLIWKK